VTSPGAKRDVCLVDGHNVMHRVPSLARLLRSDQAEEARERLREACVRFSLRRRTRVLLVFDGSRGVHAPAPRPNPLVEIVYATGARKADGLILERAERLVRERQSVVVVTEDRGIKNALPGKARTLGVRAFWSAIEPEHEDAGEDKPTPPLEDVEAFFLEAERRQKMSARKDPKKEGGT